MFKNKAVILSTSLLLAGILCGCWESSSKTLQEQPAYTADTYTASFVASTFALGTVDQGLDIDGENTQCGDGSCIPDGLEGVDNRAMELAAAMENTLGGNPNINERMQHEIASGQRLLIFRFTDVNLLPMGDLDSTDTQLQLQVYMGMDADTPPDPGDNFSGSEPMDVRAGSLHNPDNIESSINHFQQCMISEGTLSCMPSTFYVQIPLYESVLPITIHEARLEASVETSPEETSRGVYLNGSIKKGVLGGYVRVEELVESVFEIFSTRVDTSPQMLESVLMNYADLDTIPEGPTQQSCSTQEDCRLWRECRDGFCHEPADQFDALGFGFIFELESVEFTGTIIQP